MQRSVLEYLEATAARLGDKTAFADEHGAVTFGELEDRSRRLGAWLARQVPDNGTPIAVLADRCVNSPVAFMAALQCGCCYVPLDPQMPRQRLESILDQLESPVVLYDDGQEKLAAELRDRYPLEPISAHTADPVDDDLLAARRALVVDTDPVYIIFTSGSTGVPKGIVCHHRGVMDLAQWLSEAGQFTERDTLGNQAPFYFDGSVKDLYMTIKCGATCEIIPKKLFMFPKLLVDFLNEKGVTALQWATSAFHLVAASGVLADRSIPTLQKVLVGGEALRAPDLRAWRQAMPDAAYINLYGPTETTVDAAWYRVERDFDEDESIPIGRACANKELFLLDEELRPVAPGEPGELCIRGTGLAHGYYRDPEKTAAAFIRDPRCPHYPRRIYRTGDMAVERDGLFYFLSRRDGQIKHMGYRIELGEIEVALHGQEGVEAAACLFDEGRDRILCVYTGGVEPMALAKAMRRAVPKYMMPNLYERLEQMPYNGNGKIDRVQLKARFLGQ